MKGHKSKRIGLTIKLLFTLQVVEFSDISYRKPVCFGWAGFWHLSEACFILLSVKKDQHVTINHCKWVSKKQVSAYCLPRISCPCWLLSLICSLAINLSQILQQACDRHVLDFVFIKPFLLSFMLFYYIVSRLTFHGSHKLFDWLVIQCQNLNSRSLVGI